MLLEGTLSLFSFVDFFLSENNENSINKNNNKAHYRGRREQFFVFSFITAFPFVFPCIQLVYLGV